MRKCKKCGKEKDTEDFYSSNKSVCKECLKERTVLWQKNHLERTKEITAKQIAKRKDDPNYEKKQAKYYREWYAKCGRNRTKRDLEIVKLWRELNPEKCKVHSLVEIALKWGKIKKPKCCSRCGDERKLVAHHDDYEFPLKVRWLCYSCHKNLHNSKVSYSFT